MKNVMKKLFSLLLVGVVAVSMFSFVAPNNVDAAEAKLSKGHVFFQQNGDYTGNCVARFHDASGKVIWSINTGGMSAGQGSCCEVPLQTKTLTIQTKKRVPFRWSNGETFKFVFEEDDDFYRGCYGGYVEVTGEGATVFSAHFVPYCEGCWKYVGTTAR